MMTCAPHTAQRWLLPRICDTIRLRFDRICAPLHLDHSLPDNARFVSGSLACAPTLQNICLHPMHMGHGCALEGELLLPASLCFACGCEQILRTGTLHIPIKAALRTQMGAEVHFIPQAELCIRDICPQNGCLCAEIDVHLCLYAVLLQPVSLGTLCTEPPQMDCAPYFHLPLYPELPHQRR